MKRMTPLSVDLTDRRSVEYGADGPESVRLHGTVTDGPKSDIGRPVEVALSGAQLTALGRFLEQTNLSRDLVKLADPYVGPAMTTSKRATPAT